ncbi:MAG TPA: hypothetical protein VKP58_17190 [Candidatus Acidoferrum sp.]|nr:hypothetical protein [Candidatus Acidoferrum sp.]
MKKPTKWDVARLLFVLVVFYFGSVKLGGAMTRQRYIVLVAMLAVLFLIWLGGLYTSTLPKLTRHRINCISLSVIFCCAGFFPVFDLGFYHHTTKIVVSVLFYLAAVFFLWHAFHPPSYPAEETH